MGLHSIRPVLIQVKCVARVVLAISWHLRLSQISSAGFAKQAWLALLFLVMGGHTVQPACCCNTRMKEFLRPTLHHTCCVRCVLLWLCSGYRAAWMHVTGLVLPPQAKVGA